MQASGYATRKRINDSPRVAAQATWQTSIHDRADESTTRRARQPATMQRNAAQLTMGWQKVSGVLSNLLITHSQEEA